VTYKLSLAVGVDLFEFRSHSVIVISYLRPFAIDVYFKNYFQTLPRMTSTILWLNSSAVITTS